IRIANFHIISYNKYTSHWKAGDLLSNPSATFVQNLLEKAFSKQASDIHFYPAAEKNNVQVYFRMLGQRHYFSTLNSQTYNRSLIVQPQFYFCTKPTIKCFIETSNLYSFLSLCREKQRPCIFSNALSASLFFHPQFPNV